MLMLLPNEMMFRILTSSILDDHDLRNCSLACCLFRDLAQPLLFTTFLVEVPEDGPFLSFLTTRTYYERLIQHDLSSERRVALTECFIMKSILCQRDALISKYDALLIQICHAVVQSLPSFTNIMRVELVNLDVPLFVLAAVVQLPKLEALIIEGSSFPNVENHPVLVSSPQTLKVLHVSTTDFWWRSSTSEDAELRQWLPALLASPVLEELVCIDNPERWTATYLSSLLEAGETPSLKRFTFGPNISRPLCRPQFANLMRLYPNLQAFASGLGGFAREDEEPPVLPEDILPTITHLEIELNELEQFEGRKISHLIVGLPIKNFSPQSPRLPPVVARIHGIFPNVVSLQIKYGEYSIASVDLFHSFDGFSHLRQLHISAGGTFRGFAPTSSKTKNHREANPPLEYFFLDIQVPSEEFDAGIPIADLIPQLTKRYLKLKYIGYTKRVLLFSNVQRCSWMSPGYVPDVESIGVRTSFTGEDFTPSWQWF